LLLVIVTNADERVVGTVGLHVRDEPERHGEVGYWVAAPARRSGIGSRAVSLIAGWATGALGLSYIESVISPRNEASRALARRAGFTPHDRQLREFKGATEEFEIWRRPADSGS
jgi:RimJ/RimL family protein N-acetyltransferase